MLKSFGLMFLLALSFSASAQQTCATNTTQLRAMIEADHNEYSANWVQTGNNPLLISISNGGSALRLRFSKTSEGEWGVATGQVCKTNRGYALRVSNITWGAAAPSMVKSQRPSSIPLTFNGATLRVSISLWSGNFRSR